MTSAAEIVGARGYAATSIAKATENAGVSQGTFYNYFEDRQTLFDSLLPYVREKMIHEIVTEVPRTTRGWEREVERFRAYCHFLGRNPGFYRILYEAEIFAPTAHANHMKETSDGLRRSLLRSIKSGDMREVEEEELDAIVFALLGARAYIAMNYGKGTEIPESAVEGYAKLVSGMF